MAEGAAAASGNNGAEGEVKTLWIGDLVRCCLATSQLSSLGYSSLHFLYEAHHDVFFVQSYTQAPHDAEVSHGDVDAPLPFAPLSRDVLSFSLAREHQM